MITQCAAGTIVWSVTLLRFYLYSLEWFPPLPLPIHLINQVSFGILMYLPKYVYSITWYQNKSCFSKWLTPVEAVSCCNDWATWCVILRGSVLRPVEIEFPIISRWCWFLVIDYGTSDRAVRVIFQHPTTFFNAKQFSQEWVSFHFLTQKLHICFLNHLR